MALAEPLFCHPLMTDGPEIHNAIAAHACGRERHDGARDAEREDDPGRVHESSLGNAERAHCSRVNTCAECACVLASEMMHPVLQHVSRRGFVVAVGP